MVVVQGVTMRVSKTKKKKNYILIISGAPFTSAWMEHNSSVIGHKDVRENRDISRSICNLHDVTENVTEIQ